MSNHWKKYLCAVVFALMPATAAYSGEGYGFIKPNITQFSEPIEIRIKKVDGNMSLRNETLSIPIQYEAGYKGTLSYLIAVDLRVEHVSKGNGEIYNLRRNLSYDGDKDKVWGTTTITLNRAQFEPMEKYAKELCAPYQGSRDKIVDTVIPLTMHVTYYDNAAQLKFSKQGLFPTKIVCEPNRPSNPARLLQVNLGTSAQQCHKPVVLTALFAATLPADYKFKLQRDDGASQDGSVYPALKDGPVYRGQWSKAYTFNTSVTRRYRIVSETYQPLTEWVTINVHCVQTSFPQNDRGFAQPPRPLPPTHAGPKVDPSRPVIAPPRIPSRPMPPRQSAR